MLRGPSSVSILSLKDATNSFELQQKQTFNLSCAYSSQWSISSFLVQRGFSLICLMKFNEDEVVSRVLKI